MTSVSFGCAGRTWRPSPRESFKWNVQTVAHQYSTMSRRPHGRVVRQTSEVSNGDDNAFGDRTSRRTANVYDAVAGNEGIKGYVEKRLTAAKDVSHRQA